MIVQDMPYEIMLMIAAIVIAGVFYSVLRVPHPGHEALETVTGALRSYRVIVIRKWSGGSARPVLVYKCIV